MAIIKQYDKRSGITYAYESHSYWDPEKKMYEKLLKKYEAQETLIESLKKQVKELKGY